MLTVPDGSAETFESVGWVACNMAYPVESWESSKVLERAYSRGIKVIPWVRLISTQGEGAAKVQERLQLLVDTARRWHTDTILPNYEDEVEVVKPDAVALILYRLNWPGDVGWSMPAWLDNAADYRPITKWPVLLQIFPTDARWPQDYATIKQKMGDCVWHARDKGFTFVGVTYQTYANAKPAWFDVSSYQHSVFTGNTIPYGEWGQWFQ